MNVVFTKLSTEECETCKVLELSHTLDDNQKCITDCDACKKVEEHEILKREARTAYEEEAATVKDDYMVRSVDLQKVIRLPIMPGIKSVCFTK